MTHNLSRPLISLFSNQVWHPISPSHHELWPLNCVKTPKRVGLINVSNVDKITLLHVPPPQQGVTSHLPTNLKINFTHTVVSVSDSVTSVRTHLHTSFSPIGDWLHFNWDAVWNWFKKNWSVTRLLIETCRLSKSFSPTGDWSLVHLRPIKSPEVLSVGNIQ